MRARGRQAKIRVATSTAGTSWRYGTVRLDIGKDGNEIMATNKAVVFPELRDTYGQLMTEEQKIAFGIVKQWADSLTNELTPRIIEATSKRIN